MQGEVKRTYPRNNIRFKEVGNRVATEKKWSGPQGGDHVGITPELQSRGIAAIHRRKANDRLKIVEGPKPRAASFGNRNSGHTKLVLPGQHCVCVTSCGEFDRTREASFGTDSEIRGRQDLKED